MFGKEDHAFAWLFRVEYPLLLAFDASNEDHYIVVLVLSTVITFWWEFKDEHFGIGAYGRACSVACLTHGLGSGGYQRPVKWLLLIFPHPKLLCELVF